MFEVLDRVTMQVFVRRYYTMIAAPVQCDVDGIPKGPHYGRVPPMGLIGNVSPNQVVAEFESRKFKAVEIQN